MSDDEYDEEPYFNPEAYEALCKKYDAHYAALGLLDLPQGARAFCEALAEQRIRRENIVDDNGKRRIYDEVKKSTLECIEKWQKPPCCTFCYTPQNKTLCLIDGPGDVYICTVCIDICREMLGQRATFDDMVAVLQQRKQRIDKEKTMENTERSSNPFIATYQKRMFEAAQLGIKPFHAPTRDDMRDEARSRIIREDITDKEEEIKTYEAVKAQFNEYEDYLRRHGVSVPGAMVPESAEGEEYEGVLGQATTHKGDVITIRIDDSRFRQDITAVLREFLDFTQRLFEHNEHLSEEAKSLDERLKALEKYTKE